MRTLININGVAYTPASEVTEFLEGAIKWAQEAYQRNPSKAAELDMLLDAFTGLRDDWNESVAISLTEGAES